MSVRTVTVNGVPITVVHLEATESELMATIRRDLLASINMAAWKRACDPLRTYLWDAVVRRVDQARRN